jgi:hypothetical protein
MGFFKCVILFILLLLVIGIIVFVIWWRRNRCGKQKNCGKKKKGCESDDEDCCLQTLCKDVRKLCKRIRHAELREQYDIQQLNTKITEVADMQHDLLGEWSLNFDQGDGTQDPGTINNQPMLKASVNLGFVASDSQTAASSIQPAVADGILDSLTVEASSTLSGGTVNITVYINGLPVLLTASFTSLSSTLITVYPSSDIAFSAGDTLGLSFSSSGATMTTLPAKYTAQLFVQYTA